MKRILLLILILSSLETFSQGWKVFKVGNVEYYKFLPPNNYSFINGRYRWLAGMFDSALHVPTYNGVPSGVRTNIWPHDGAIAMDTTNGSFYGYRNSAWFRVANYSEIAGASSNIYNSDGILTGNRTLTGANDTRSLTLDSLLSFSVRKNNLDRILMNGSGSYIVSPNGLSQVFAGNGILSMNAVSGANYLSTVSDSSFTKKKIAYETNLHSTFTPYTLVDVAYGDSAWGGGGGGTPGGSDKQVQYNNAGAFGGSAGFETALSNNRVKITAQATTEVPLEIHLAGSQTAHAFKIINSAAADLAYFEADGDLVLTTTSGKKVTSTGTELVLRQTGGSFGESGIEIKNQSGSAGGIFYNNGLDLVDMGFRTSTAEQFNFRYEHRSGEFIPGNANGEFQFIKSSSSDVFGRFGQAYGAFEGSFLIGGTDEEVPGAKLDVDGTIKVRSISQDNTETKLVVWNSTDKILEYKTAPSLNKAVTIESPSSSEAVDMWQTPVAITVTSLKAILRGSSPSVTYNIRFGTDITSSTDVFTSNITCTSVTTGCSNSSGFNDATIPAGSFIWVITSAASGTISSISLTLNYTED